MNNKLLIGFMIMAAVGLAGCQTSGGSGKQSNSKALTNAELTKLYSVTQTVAWTNLENSASGDLISNPNGTVSTDWGTGSSKGTWRIVDNTLWTTWTTGSFRGAGVEECVTLHKMKEGTYKLLLPNGSWKYTNTFK